MSPTFSFCLGFFNRQPEHLSRCLASIRRMTSADRIVVCDLGSEPETLERVARICAEHDAVLVVHPAEEWSRSLALNVAARNAGECSHLVLMDADSFLARNFRTVAGRWARLNRACLTRSRDTDETQDLSGLLKKTDAELGAMTTPHPEVGMGAAIVCPRAAFFKLRGFCEQMSVWGAEESSLVVRLQRIGLHVGWLADTFSVHQWHDRNWCSAEQFEQVKRNRAILADLIDGRHPVVCNGETWGGVKE